MAAAIDFFVNNLTADFNVDLNGSGLGFYGSTFGSSVAVGSYQDKTFVTNATGIIEGSVARNVKWTHANSGEANTVSLNLQKIPNFESTLNVRFTNDTAVKATNVELRIYDGTDITAAASGLLPQVAEIIHVSTSQAVTGSGDSAWIQPSGDTVKVTMADSPGMSGLFAENGTGSTESTVRHDWYCSLSASPTSIGSKTNFGLYFALEYI